MAAHRFALIVALSGACASGTQSSASAPHAGNTQAANSQSTAQGTASSAANQASFTVSTARVVGPSNLYIPKIRVIGEQQEERLYWVDYLGNAGYLSLANGSTTTLKVNPGEFAMNSEDFFVSEEYVFAASKELSGIVVANRRGGIVRTIPTEAFVTDVAATANRVYWIDGTGLNSLSLADDGTPDVLGKAQERDVLVATATHALFKNDAQRLYLLSDSTMTLVAQDVAKVALWLDEVFIVKSGRTRVEVHSDPQGPTEYEFTLDEPSEQFAVGAGGICSLSGASITCYDHGSGKRIFTHEDESGDQILHLAVSRDMVFWSNYDKSEIWAAPLASDEGEAKPDAD